ncbi:MAG: RNA polymerase, sigma-24 subunit, ECF subfamily [Parcubacteria group bacterium GW2011_GWB1_36_5]|nr:MAG: RNA polymerase, sigma-24 subunit, ECF subfamily [Parcubacteria group bacterium GW2011_GWA2_36_24]KKQ07313.1 MAG: RNA polymerase, sigma-24 subunit, ECF subfamily [Parcubacteria group bacterium GW2011_GWB1_36_5]
MLFNETDEEIIDLYKNGNQEAFKNLIDRYTPSIFNFSARLTDKDNASDLAQEIFVKAWRNLHKFDISKASFKTWLFTIAKNTIIDFLKKKKSLNFSDLDLENFKDEITFSETIPDENLLPDETLQKLQDSELLNKLLEKLPIHYKTILILHYQGEMTFVEIGKILDKPLNTVKSYHQRAILKLKKMVI